MNRIQCQQCGQIDEAEYSPGYTCPSCGNTEGFDIQVSIHDSGTIYENVRVVEKELGAKKPSVDAWSGHDLHEDSGEYRDVEQVVDRKNNRYRKRVIRPTGEIVKDIDGPLTGHDGGSAHRRRRKDESPNI